MLNQMKNITLLTFAAALSCSMSAQEPLQQYREVLAPQQVETSTSLKSAGRTLVRNAKENNQPRFLGIRKVTKAAQNEKGTIVNILSEDFSQFKTGKIGAPDFDADTKNPAGYDYPWINQDDKLYSKPGWGGDNMFPAGGCVYLQADDETFQAHINTPMLNVAGYEGVAFIRFKARTDEGDIVSNAMLEAAETNNMGPEWNVLGGIVLPDITDEWAEYEAAFYGAGPTTLFNMVATCGGTQYDPIPQSWYIDDIEVYQIDTYIHMPKTNSHTDYKGTSFKANWEPVEGADHYLLTVYDYSEGFDHKHYLLQDAESKETSYLVENTEPGRDYYYSVKAVDAAGHESYPTIAVEVTGLETPIMEAPGEIANGKYSASWKPVLNAERYNYMALVKRVAEQDGEFIITSENFTGIADAEGNPTGWTKEEPQSNSYDVLYLNGLNQGGWVGTQYAPYDDYICLDGWQYIYNKKDASLQSPVLDLSKDNGKLRLSAKLCGAKFDLSGFVDENGKPLSGWKVVDAAAAMFNYDVKSNSYVQTELYYNRNLTEDWQTCLFDFTTGSENSTVGIFCVQPENLYVDDVIISQNYKAGEEFLDPFCYFRYLEETGTEVELPQRTLNKEIYHKVNAVKTTSEMSPTPGKLIESKYSDMAFVGNATTTGIKETGVSAQDLFVRLEGNTIVAENPEEKEVTLWTVDGKLLYADKSGDQQVRIPAPESGVYLVKVGDRTVKLGF